MCEVISIVAVGNKKNIKFCFLILRQMNECCLEGCRFQIQLNPIQIFIDVKYRVNIHRAQER